MKRKVRELREWLDDIDGDWDVWAYEGEVTGIVVAPRHITGKSKVFKT